MNGGLPLRAFIGARVREVREEAGGTQDAVARAAQRYGLKWDRSKVAALERGEKPITLDELVLLPRILTEALQDEVRIPDLFDSDGRVGLAGDRVWVSARSIAKALSGGPLEGVLTRQEQHEWDAGIRVYERLDELGFDVRGRDLGRAELAAGEAEAKAARRFGEHRRVIIGVAVALWGRSMTEERDARVAVALGDSADPRAAQAVRGHVTRQLTAELARAAGLSPKEKT